MKLRFWIAPLEHLVPAATACMTTEPWLQMPNWVPSELQTMAPSLAQEPEPVPDDGEAAPDDAAGAETAGALAVGTAVTLAAADVATEPLVGTALPAAEVAVGTVPFETAGAVTVSKVWIVEVIAPVPFEGADEA